MVFLRKLHVMLPDRTSIRQGQGRTLPLISCQQHVF